MITSTHNPLVRDVVTLHRSRHRRAAGRILLEGPNVVGGALDAGIRPELLLTTDPDQWVGAAERVEAVSDDVLARVSTTVTPQDPVAVAVRPAPAGGEREVRLICWQVSDPGNLGTLVRTAAAFGADVVVGGEGAVDPWSPKVLRAGAGAHFRTAVVEVDRFADAAGSRPTAALVVEGGVDPAELPAGSLAIVVGSEAHGLPDEVVDACDHRVTIPMPGGTESLNAAMAGAVALYAVLGRS